MPGARGVRICGGLVTEPLALLFCGLALVELVTSVVSVVVATIVLPCTNQYDCIIRTSWIILASIGIVIGVVLMLVFLRIYLKIRKLPDEGPLIPPGSFPVAASAPGTYVGPADITTSSTQYQHQY